MYCGAKQVILEDVTLRQLLAQIPDSMLDQKVQVMTSGKFYLHFDVDGEFLNIDTRPWPKEQCPSKSEECSTCANYTLLSSAQSALDVKPKVEEVKRVPEVAEKSPEPVVTKQVEAVKEVDDDEDTLTVNGVPFMDVPAFIQDYNKKRSNKKVKAKQTECQPIIDNNEKIVVPEESKKVIEPDTTIDKVVEAAMKNVLTKMLKSLD